MMTIDDEGEGGVWPMITSSQKSKIFGILQGILPKFFQRSRKGQTLKNSMIYCNNNDSKSQLRC